MSVRPARPPPPTPCRLARRWRSLNVIVTTLLASISSTFYLTLLLLLFMFIMALLGMQVGGEGGGACWVA